MRLPLHAYLLGAREDRGYPSSSIPSPRNRDLRLALTKLKRYSVSLLRNSPRHKLGDGSAEVVRHPFRLMPTNRLPTSIRYVIPT